VQGARLRFARRIVAVRELNGAEEPLEGLARGGALADDWRPPLALRDGAVVLDFEPFRPRTVAVRLAAPPTTVSPAAAQPLELPFNRDGISGDVARTDGDFDGTGRTIAGDLLPAALVSGGIPFHTGPQAPGRANVVECRGQALELPEGSHDRLYLLAAAVGGDRPATFTVDGRPVMQVVPDWAEAVGQWDNRLVAGALQTEPANIAPGYAQTSPVAWVGTHRHGARGENEAYAFTTSTAPSCPAAQHRHLDYRTQASS
jgi:alpha-mannosidase